MRAGLPEGAPLSQGLGGDGEAIIAPQTFDNIPKPFLPRQVS